MISIIIPVFNEQAGIEPLAKSLATLRTLWPSETIQYVFVDDGSSDRTAQELARVFDGDRNCAIIKHGLNRGIGAAFRTGFAHAGGDIVCTIDADCSYGPEKLRQLVDALESQGADIAVASPYHPDGHVEGVPAWRLLLSRTCSLLYRAMSPVRLYTYTSVFRAYRRGVLERIGFRQDGFVSVVELLLGAARQGFRIVEVPMTLHGRKVGTSKMKIMRTIRQHLRMILQSAIHRRPARVILKADGEYSRCDLKASKGQ